MSVSPSFHSDMWACMPEPFSSKIGLGMKVADLAGLAGDVRATYL